MRASAAARKFTLTAHVVASVGWLGAIVAFLGLAITGLAADDVQLVRGVYLVAEPLTWFVIVPLAVASLVTGIVQSLVTTWGLVQHYWVIFKLVLTVVATVVLLLYTQTVASLADRAQVETASLSQLRAPTFVLHSGAALLLLLAATALAVYKPAGRTRYGWRKQQKRPGRTPPDVDAMR